MGKNTGTSLISEPRKEKFCVSCGCRLSGRKRRYCSPDCKELLLFALSWLKNLLLPLKTNYATFSFTDAVLIINILSFFSKEVTTFVWKREPGKTPAEGLKEVCKVLNREWYNKNRTSRSQRTASEHLLNMGLKDFVAKHDITPIAVNTHSKITRKLTHFNLRIEDLERNPMEKLRSAYRKEVKKHHPDYGGDPADFITISEAYKDIVDHILHPGPTRTRTGLPGKWSYDSCDRKWSAPL